jgi:hypothetical protein
MCFSPEASFILGSAILSGGGACLYRALRTSPRYIPMALFPMMVGIQQIAEGGVWMGLGSECGSAVTAASFIYLFFAWLIWPFWVPFMTWMVEPNPHQRRVLIGFMAVGALWGVAMYLPYLWNPGWLATEIVGQSIHYTNYFWMQEYVPDTVLFAAYLSIIGMAPIVSSHVHMQIFGILLVVSAHIAYAFFAYAVTSVLCFFAAAITAYLLLIIWKDKCAQRAAL